MKKLIKILSNHFPKSYLCKYNFVRSVKYFAMVAILHNALYVLIDIVKEIPVSQCLNCKTRADKLLTLPCDMIR